MRILPPSSHRRSHYVRLIILFLFPFNTFAQGTDDFCGIKNQAIKSGEELHYKVFYTLVGAYIGAGEASFTTQVETYNGKPVFHVKGSGHSYKSYDWFYKVRDLYESLIDTASMLPLKFTRNVNERNTHIYNQVLFNHQTKKAVSTNGVFSIPDCVQDVLSAIYYARNIDYSKFKVGDKIPFNLFIDDKSYPIFIRYLGKFKLHTKYGTFNTIQFKPLLIEGTIFKGGEDMTVWVTDDLNKIPVMVETPLLIGRIKVYLSSYKQLRNKPQGFVQFNPKK
jgi:hypothetical protein